ncbi:30S ribosomal protein S12 methylthiotransferase RimO [Caminibacter pacificus]|uniref:Ribosomal protein uS12 methylthiotransferase RimO n=1 Tax=Caminibacter pacificus TaxID=1424653 RepID=A0AAJ4RCT0_9BACT|nr:30S ribosomal protein S12 methylthiotransferase RimO [Caminibacter pacificus]QCI27789.1 30S ribosomal protein S12 methylthiotransferase RimO [Caminibacter pacificus]ROR40036.1 SSU ribosomal protein S12P methylthiotransferase [Caminibacter pacificus]
MKKLYLASLGCVKNLIDSEVMLGRLKDEYELTQNPSEADLIIVNTCGFINPAKEESIETILELANEKKENAKLVVTGCLSERYKDILPQEIPEVDIWSGVGDFGNIDKVIKSNKKKYFSPKVYLIHNEDRVITGSAYHAYIKLSEGCNQKCAFCAIPNFKGRLNSRPIEEIIEEIKRLKAKGYKDFSLASQDSSSYLRDKGIKDGLERLIDEIDKIEGITVRILYLYPATTTKRLIRKIFSSKKVQNYFDMPIQHISPKMLKIMRRPGSVERLKELLYEMRKEFSFVRTSVIVGHPGESEEDFNELKEFLKEYEFDRVNVFAYSDEEDTPAFKRKDKIPQDIIEKRVKEISKIVKKTTKKALKKYVGKICECYMDGLTKDNLFYSVRPKLWAPEVDGDILVNESEIENLKVGELYKVKVENLAGEDLIGKIIK